MGFHQIELSDQIRCFQEEAEEQLEQHDELSEILDDDHKSLGSGKEWKFR